MSKVLTSVLAILALGTLSLALDENAVRLQRSLRRNVHDSSSDPASVRNRVAAKYASNALSYFRNTGKHHPIYHGTMLSKRAGSSEIPLESESGWTAEVGIGKSVQTFNIVFDSGSADMTMNAGTYDPAKSTTSKNLQKVFSSNYMGGKADGNIFSDQVLLGRVKANDVSIGQATEQFMPGGDHVQGVIGLSFPSLSAFGTSSHTFPEALQREQDMDQNVFQFNLRDSDPSLIIGKTDESEVDGGFGWIDVSSQDGYWVVDAELNGKAVKGIVDSGTTVIIGNNDEVKEVLDKLDHVRVTKSERGEYQGMFQCDNPPRVSINIAGKEVGMSKEALTLATDGTNCQMSMLGMKGLNGWILGESFFQVASVVLDFDTPRIGIGKLK